MHNLLSTSFLQSLPEHLLDLLESVTIIDQGRANTALLSLRSGLELFVKQCDVSTLNNEQKALTLLAKCKVVDRFLFPVIYQQHDRLLVTFKLAGTAINNIANILEQGKLAQALAQLHQLKIGAGEVDFPAITLPCTVKFKHALEQANCPQRSKVQLVSVLTQVLNKLEQVPAVMGLVHGDLTPDNLMLSKERQLIILDWELAAWADVRWDLAAVCEEFDLTAQQVKRLVLDYTTYSASAAVEFESGLNLWRFIYLVVCFTWAWQYEQPYQEYLLRLLQRVEEIK